METTMTTNTTLTAGSLVRGTYAALKTTTTEYTATSSGTYDGCRLVQDRDEDPDTHSLYLYFVNGEINGTTQPIHGCPLARLDVIPNEVVAEVALALATAAEGTIIWRNFTGYRRNARGLWVELASGPETLSSLDLAYALTAR
jgi:hypothetical protein